LSIIQGRDGAAEKVAALARPLHETIEQR